MKKLIFSILFISMLVITGCENKKEENKTTTSSTSTTIGTSSTSTSTTTQTTTKESTTTKSTKTTTTKKTTTKATTTACRAKKFDKKYSYVYKTEEECKKGGNKAFIDVSDNINHDVFVYACRKITDECGTDWYGVYFYVYNHTTNKEEEFNY